MAQYTCKIAAQAAQDALGKSYTTYVIPEPKSYQKWRDGMKKLNSTPRDQIGVDPDVQPPEKYGSIVLKRGGAPLDLELCGELLSQLQSDKKNLLIFDVQKVK